MIAEPLHSAYLRTTYWVDAKPQPVALRIGQGSAVLDRLLARQRVRRWAFVTAWNPASRRDSAWRNDARQRRLLQQLRAGRYRWLLGLGESDDGEWAEPSVLVLGISAAQAERLARQFRQNAVVVGRLGGQAGLRWVQPRRLGDAIRAGTT